MVNCGSRQSAVGTGVGSRGTTTDDGGSRQTAVGSRDGSRQTAVGSRTNLETFLQSLIYSRQLEPQPKPRRSRTTAIGLMLAPGTGDPVLRRRQSYDQSRRPTKVIEEAGGPGAIIGLVFDRRGSIFHCLLSYPFRPPRHNLNKHAYRKSRREHRFEHRMDERELESRHRLHKGERGLPALLRRTLRGALSRRQKPPIPTRLRYPVMERAPQYPSNLEKADAHLRELDERPFP